MGALFSPTASSENTHELPSVRGESAAPTSQRGRALRHTCMCKEVSAELKRKGCHA